MDPTALPPPPPLFPPMVFSALVALLGICLLLLFTLLLPRFLARFTPHLDEEREIAEGNRAVAEYNGRIVSALIIGISLIVATSIYVGLY